MSSPQSGAGDREVGVDKELGGKLADGAFSSAGIEPTLEDIAEDRALSNRL